VRPPRATWSSNKRPQRWLAARQSPLSLFCVPRTAFGQVHPYGAVHVRRARCRDAPICLFANAPIERESFRHFALMLRSMLGTAPGVNIND
jgi:hypothetical protein